LFEIADAFAEALADVGQTPGAKQQQGDAEDDENLYESWSHRSSLETKGAANRRLWPVRCGLIMLAGAWGKGYPMRHFPTCSSAGIVRRSARSCCRAARGEAGSRLFSASPKDPDYG